MTPPPGTARPGSRSNKAAVGWIAAVIAIATLVGEIRRALAELWHHREPTPNDVQK